MTGESVSYSHESLSGEHVKPGPIDKGKDLKPSEIVCIETLKVYDFCFQQDQREPCDILEFRKVDLSEEFFIWCDIVPDSFTCEEVGREPLDDEGLQQVTLEIRYTVEVFIEQDGKESSDTITDAFRKTIILCAPEGTEIDCHTHSEVQCDDVFVREVIEPKGKCALAEVCAHVIICLVVQSFAVVKLLVPSFGFCFPAPCVAAPKVKPCPPEPLFPPQC